MSRLSVMAVASSTAFMAGAAVAGAAPFDERESQLERFTASAEATTTTVSLDDVDLSLVREVTVTWLDPVAVAASDAHQTPPARDATSPTLAVADDAVADDEAGAGAEPADEPVYVAADGDAIDAARIGAFLAGRDAPLADYAEEIVNAGVEHDVDPRLVVGIAIAESNGGERLPASTHNAWGWSGSGPHGLRAWDSWEESIDTFTERLGALYDTDNVDVDFAQTYCPPNWQWWLDTVTWSMDQI